MKKCCVTNVGATTIVKDVCNYVDKVQVIWNLEKNEILYRPFCKYGLICYSIARNNSKCWICVDSILARFVIEKKS